MRNVGERSRVDKDRSSLETLHQGRLDRVLHQDRERTRAANVVARDRFARPTLTDHHPAEAVAHVAERIGEREHGHALGRDGNVKPSLERLALLGGSETGHDLAEVAVVDVDDATPRNLGRVNVEADKLADLLLGEVVRVRLVDPELLETLEHDRSERADALLGRAQAAEQGLVGLGRFVEVASADRSREEVVGSRRGVDIAGQVQVELVHRNDLTVSTTGGTALDTESRALTRLTNARVRRLAEVRTESLGETERRGRLALYCAREIVRQEVCALCSEISKRPEAEAHLQEESA